MEFEPLTSVVVVLRSVTPDGEALPHVLSLVSSYLDGAIPTRWSVERACERGFGLRMLKRLAAHEAAMTAMTATDSTPSLSNVTTTTDLLADPLYRSHLASKALVAAIQRADDVDVVRWVCCEYCPSVVPVNAVVEAASAGRLRVLHWLLTAYPSVQPNAYVAEKAVESGRLDVLQWLLPRTIRATDRDFEQLLVAAATRGDLAIVQWLHEHQQVRKDATDRIANGTGNAMALVHSIEHGHKAVAQFLASHGYPLDSPQRWCIVACARFGDLAMLQWLHERQYTSRLKGWMREAAVAGHLHVVQWVHENLPGDYSSTDAMDEAATHGHLDIVQWLHTNRTDECSARAMDWAASNGHLDVVQWLHEHRDEGCSTWAMDGAAGLGHLHVVQWLHEHRLEGCTPSAMDGAAANGRLDVLQWLHENRREGCTSEAMDRAAARGHLEVVKWLHENRNEGCTTDAMTWAAEHGHLEVVTWLHDHRSEGCTVSAMDCAAKNGHVHVVQWLHANRTEGCSVAALNHSPSVPMLWWLHAHRTEGCTHSAMADAVRSGNFAKLLFLKETGLGRFQDRLAVAALESGNFDVFVWLRTNYPRERLFAAALQRYRVGTGNAGEMFFQFETGR